MRNTKNKILLIIAILTTFLLLNNNVYADESNEKLWKVENIVWECLENKKLDKDGKKLYDADFIINNLFFSFWDKDFSANCLNNIVDIQVEWTGKYTFNVLDKKIVNKDSIEKIIYEIEKDINNLNKTTEWKFDTFLNVEKMTYTEKEKYINDNKDIVYQELYEVLNILNKDVQYYEVDENGSYTETDIFTDNTKMIELYK